MKRLDTLMFIGKDKPFVWSLKRILEGWLTIREVNRTDDFKKELKSFNSSSSIVVLDSENEDDTQYWLWDVIRPQNLHPFVTLGYAKSYRRFLPEFTTFSAHHLYLRKPLSLFLLLISPQRLESISDQKRMKDISQRCKHYDDKIRFLAGHQIKSNLNGYKFCKKEDCINAYKSIMALLPYSNIKEISLQDIQKEIQYLKAEKSIQDRLQFVEKVSNV